MTSALFINLTILSIIVGIAYSVGIYEQCDGEGFGTFSCDEGLACFRRNRWYSSCQYECPRNLAWDCEVDLPPLPPIATIALAWDQCGGDAWVGPTECETGYYCYARSVFYSQCRPLNDCPAGWICNDDASNATATGPIVLAPFAKCNDVGTAVCPEGTGCFRNNAEYSECRSDCPATWACETDTAGLFEQCGGEGYVGLTRCAEGLQCYTRTKWYAQCSASCPGADWIC